MQTFLTKKERMAEAKTDIFGENENTKEFFLHLRLFSII